MRHRVFFSLRLPATAWSPAQKWLQQEDVSPVLPQYHSLIRHGSMFDAWLFFSYNTPPFRLFSVAAAIDGAKTGVMGPLGPRDWTIPEAEVEATSPATAGRLVNQRHRRHVAGASNGRHWIDYLGWVAFVVCQRCRRRSTVARRYLTQWAALTGLR